ncbi:Aerobic glycerol-3-phosphate dehydrogenase [Cedecea neteri]|uniref:glycerol-3-phosphate dehydrogenase n=1 Tax=Cedecea neteri TaxID=158822 RepID=A0A2X2TEC2_9ENTR|nr:Aerobic glycerol-3-phosphate dehydrogenase [Cedecea neteri]
MSYLLNVYNAHFKKTLTKDDIVWTYSGVRPLCDDESDSPQAVTRDYTLDIHDENGQAPLLSVFGGKLTTYRKLAEHVLDKLERYYPNIGPAWTKECRLPGGDIGGDRDDYAAKLRRRYGFLSESLARHLARTYGSNSELVLGEAKTLSDLGEDFGHEFYEAELRYLVEHEWVKCAEDALWRRTKLGMWLNEEQQTRVSQWLVKQAAKAGLSLAS